MRHTATLSESRRSQRALMVVVQRAHTYTDTQTRERVWHTAPQDGGIPRERHAVRLLRDTDAPVPRTRRCTRRAPVGELCTHAHAGAGRAGTHQHGRRGRKGGTTAALMRSALLRYSMQSAVSCSPPSLPLGRHAGGAHTADTRARMQAQGATRARTRGTHRRTRKASSIMPYWEKSPARSSRVAPQGRLPVCACVCMW